MAISIEVVSALPTKTFFVEMLTKDVSLPSAIMDLIDNSIDGALRLRGANPLTGLEVKITANRNKFTIQDNCGGIPLDVARRYAFRFGRSHDAPSYDDSVGLFGVGMKRAIFKLGRTFEIKSLTSDESFRVKVDVDQWLNQNEWEFPLEVRTSSSSQGARITGTRIVVDRLFDGVAGQFALAAFMDRVRSEISAKHQVYISRGLTINVNGVPLSGTAVQFAYLQHSLQPAFEQRSYNGVTVEIYSGIGAGGPRARSDAGWYVYCNGRMVVRADQTELTGWGGLGVQRIPRYHHQFSRFRGCTFLSSRMSSHLPWNTTKDGLDVEADLYRTTRLRMISHMRPVINFLNALDKEFDQSDESKRVLNNMLERADYAPVYEIPDNVLSHDFYYRLPPPLPEPPRTTRISYQRPKTEVEALKRALGVRTNRAVGERTFDWYLENECDFEV